MPSDDTKILEFNQYQKSDKATFIIYADLKCIIEKIDGFKNNPENSSTTKVSKHIPSDFSMLLYKCLVCNKNCQTKFNETLKERFFNTYKFFNHDNNKFILLLQKGIYPYEYVDDWEKFNEKSLPEKEDFYSQLDMEATDTDTDIDTDTDNAHAKRVCKDFEIKKFRRIS